MMQCRRDDSSDDTATQFPLEIILPVAASVVFLLVLVLGFVHRMYRKLDAQAKSVLHSPSLLVMSDLEANRQWLNGLECLKCLGLGRPKSVCSFGLEVKCRGEGTFDDDDDAVPSPTFHALPQNVFFPKGRPSPLSCTTSWFQKDSSYYGCISPGAKSLFGGEAVPDIQITVPMTAADKATPPFLQNRRWTRAFKHDLGLVNGGMRSRTEIPSECSPLRRLGPRRRVISAPRALFNLRLARSAVLPTITEALESSSNESGAIKGFVEEAPMSKIENRTTAAAGLAPESRLSSIISLPLIVSLSQPSGDEPRLQLSYSSSAPGFTSQRTRDASCGGSCSSRNAPPDGTDRSIVAVDSSAIECSSFSSSSADDDDDSDISPSFLPYFNSGSSSTACIPTSSSCCSPSRRLSSGTSDIAYSGCDMSAFAGAVPTSVVPSIYDCASVGPSHDTGNKRESLLNGLAGVELWIDEDVDLFYYVDPAY